MPLSESIIKKIHYLVLADKREDRGVYRRVPVRIMGAGILEPPRERYEKVSSQGRRYGALWGMMCSR